MLWSDWSPKPHWPLLKTLCLSMNLSNWIAKIPRILLKIVEAKGAESIEDHSGCNHSFGL